MLPYRWTRSLFGSGSYRCAEAQAKGRQQITNDLKQLGVEKQRLVNDNIELQDAQEKRSQIEVGLMKLHAELKYLDETGRKELNLSPAEMAAEDHTELDEAGLAEAEDKYQDVKALIDALGPVNSLALEEFHVESEKYDFLNPQRQELLDSNRASVSPKHTRRSTSTSARCARPTSVT